MATTTAPPASEGFFPLDDQLELGAGVWSESLEREMVWLSAAVGSFALAETIMQRIGRKSISCSSIWRCTQAAGERFRALEELQESIAAKINEDYLGRTVNVLFEEKVKERWKGRTTTNKLVFAESGEAVAGKVLPVKTTWSGP